jgi:uncharacterized protein YxjI
MDSNVLTMDRKTDLKVILQQPLTFHRKLSVAGNRIHVNDLNGNMVMYVKQKAFKLKEDIRVYNDKSKSREILYIQARQVIDISATYDVTDQTTGEKVGALRRKGLASAFVKDQWEMLDNSGIVIGDIVEDSTLLALIRRYAINIIPQAYSFSQNGMEIAKLKQRFNPFLFKADFQVLNNEVDPRLSVAGAVLMMCIEGRQQ